MMMAIIRTPILSWIRPRVTLTGTNTSPSSMLIRIGRTCTTAIRTTQENAIRVDSAHWIEPRNSSSTQWASEESSHFAGNAEKMAENLDIERAPKNTNSPKCFHFRELTLVAGEGFEPPIRRGGLCARGATPPQADSTPRATW